jgi:D-alanine-D-alanine ligase
MSKFSRVLVVAGGLTAERSASLHSADKVMSALRSQGIQCDLQDFDAKLMPWIMAYKPDVIFPVLHGACGEDGVLQEIIEISQVPFVGAKAESARLAFDKPSAKTLLRRAGLSTPKSLVLPRQAFQDLGARNVIAKIGSHFDFPVCVKPRSGGSALGISKISQKSDLKAGIRHCFSYHDEALIEEWIDGVEIAVGVLVLNDSPVTALPAVEISPDGEFYNYEARYTAGSTEFFTPARLSKEVSEAAAQAAIKAHEVLGLRQILECNVAPGLTETSTFPMALGSADIAFSDFCRRAVMSAAEQENIC